MKKATLLLAAMAGFLVISASHAQAQYWHRPGYYGGFYPRFYYGPTIVVAPAPVPAYYEYSYSVAVDVQVALKRRGYYRGPIDGGIGPESRAAIKAYQYDRELPLSGRIDRPLLHSLGL